MSFITQGHTTTFRSLDLGISPNLSRNFTYRQQFIANEISRIKELIWWMNFCWLTGNLKELRLRTWRSSSARCAKCPTRVTCGHLEESQPQRVGNGGRFPANLTPSAVCRPQTQAIKNSNHTAKPSFIFLLPCAHYFFFFKPIHTRTKRHKPWAIIPQKRFWLLILPREVPTWPTGPGEVSPAPASAPTGLSQVFCQQWPMVSVRLCNKFSQSNK